MTVDEHRQILGHHHLLSEGEVDRANSLLRFPNRILVLPIVNWILDLCDAFRPLEILILQCISTTMPERMKPTHAGGYCPSILL